MPKKGEVHRTSYLLQAFKKIILPLNGRNSIIGKHEREIYTSRLATFRTLLSNSFDVMGVS